MVKPEQLTASVSPTDLDNVWEWDRKRETLLKFKEEEEVTPWESPPAVSSQVWEAMQRLMDILLKLRSPDSGWPENLPQTPENLLPYVIEEAYEVSDALKEVTPQSINASESPYLCPFTSLFSSDSPYLLIEELNYRLLWYIARSSYELMQLLGGINTRLLQENGNRETGILRLVPILEVNTLDRDWFLDLVTSQPPQTNLNPQTLIQLAATDCEIQQLKQRLIEQIQVTNPEARPFIEKATVELLEPGKSWQTGDIRLNLDFEFIAGDHEGITENESTGQDLIIRLINPTLINYYCQGLLLPDLSIFVNEMPNIDSLEGEEMRSHLETIIERAINLVNRCLINPCYLCFTHKINLDEWIPLLLWQLTSISYDFMRLLGGVKACILQPEWGWDIGTLRLIGVITVESINSKLQLDLATGQPLKSKVFSIMDDTIIKVNDSGLSLDPERVVAITNHLTEQIEAISPALTSLIEGTTIELLKSSNTQQTGFIKLSLDLEFIPE